MLNPSIISLTSLILIYQNILLLNEETLIFICFLVFCSVMFVKLKEPVQNELEQNIQKIETTLKISLGYVLKTLKINLEKQKKFQSLPKSFEILGNHFFKLSSAISNESPALLNKKSESIYTKKFTFVLRLEKQTFKLLALLISQKLGKLLTTQKFCTQELKIPNFIRFQNITLLKHLMRV